MVTSVRDHFGEDSLTATQVSPAQVLSFLNQAMVEICADSNILVSAWTTSTVAAQQLYTVPPEYTSVEEIQLYQTNGTQIWLTKTELSSLDPRLSTGTPERFAVWGANSAGDNSPVFMLDPIPATSGSSDLTCWGRQLPKTMVSGGQGPEVRTRWQYAVVNGAVSMCYARVAANDPSIIPLWDRAERKWQADKLESQQSVYVDLKAPQSIRDTMGYTKAYRR